MMNKRNIDQLSTPAFLVEHKVVQANCARMGAKATALGVRLRPHMKSHKLREVGLLQVRDHFGGITVSTLAEARFFSAGGCSDITYAVPICPSKLKEAASLSKQLTHLNLLLDHPATLAALQEYGRLHQVNWRVLLKVDSGYHRAGVDPNDPASIELARAIHGSAHMTFLGVLTHAGHSYDCLNAAQVREVAAQEVAVTVAFAQRLREAGIPCDEVSIGSTPTCVQLESAQGVTEIRPGNYAFFDKFQADIGSCQEADIAGSVLSRVIGHYPTRGEILIDAGALALGKDPGATHVNPDCGFGKVMGYAHLQIKGLSQEHGKVAGMRPEDYATLPIGARLRILPNHVCLTSALYGEYNVVEGDEVVYTWKPARGW